METITIVTDVYPPRSGKPANVVVAATAKGGTPHFRSGPFSDRHRLIDEAYGEALKLGLKAESRKAAKPASKPAGKPGNGKKAKGAGAATPAFGEPGHFPSKAESEADQIGPEETAAPAGGLPEIEGDDAPAAADDEQLELTLEEDHG